MVVITSSIKKATFVLLFVLFIFLTVNAMMSGFSKTIVVKDKNEKFKYKRRRSRLSKLYYVLTDESGITYEIDDIRGRNVKVGVTLNVKGYKSLITRQRVISEIL
jgi:hypothetical protein